MSSEIKVSSVKAKDGTAGISIADSTGRVTFSDSHSLIAGTGAFLASMTSASWAIASDNEVLPYNDVSTEDRFDTDSNYNTSTYKYQAPATGVYFFYYGVYTAQNDAGNAFGYETNNGEINNQPDGANFFTQKSGDLDHIQTCSLIIPLTANDTIWVSARGTSDYYKGHSYWGGCRLK